MSLDDDVRQRWNRILADLKVLLHKLDPQSKVGGEVTDYTIVRDQLPAHQKPGMVSLKPKGFIVLENLPPRATNGPVNLSERVNIFVNGYLVFNETTGVLEEYCTKVMYFCKSDPDRPMVLKPVDGFRCEMDITNEPSHPLFHMQRHNAVAQPDIQPEQRLNKYRLEDPLDGLFASQHIRIPTAQLDLLSIFVPLVADHFIVKGMPQNKLDLYKKFVKKTRELAPRVQEKFAPILTMVQEDKVAHASHWYPAH